MAAPVTSCTRWQNSCRSGRPTNGQRGRLAQYTQAPAIALNPKSETTRLCGSALATGRPSPLSDPCPAVVDVAGRFGRRAPGLRQAAATGGTLGEGSGGACRPVGYG